MSDERELPEQVWWYHGASGPSKYSSPVKGERDTPYLRADKPVGYVLVHYDTGEVKSDISQDPEELRAIRLYGEHVHPAYIGPAIEEKDDE